MCTNDIVEENEYMISCVAHRGWSSVAPENTLAAIQKAVDHPAVSTIEFDVQLSSDGVPIVIHDFSLERTTNGIGLVKEKTLKELKELDANYKFPNYKAEKIPTLAEVLEISKGKARLNIELKTIGDLYSNIEQTVGKMIKEFKMEQEVVVTSFQHHYIKLFKESFPEISAGIIIEGNPVLLFEQLKYTGSDTLSISFKSLYPEFVKEILNRNYHIIAWTVNETDDMKKLINMDNRIAVCTNHIEKWEKLF